VAIASDRMLLQCSRRLCVGHEGALRHCTRAGDPARDSSHRLERGGVAAY
jgi:hypothetical protein